MYIKLCNKHSEELSDGLEIIFSNTWSKEDCQVEGCNETWSTSYKGAIPESVLSERSYSLVISDPFNGMKPEVKVYDEYSFVENSGG